MSKKYKTRWSSIYEVEIERETESSVWINGSRSAKVTSWERYFDSFAEAKAYLTEDKQRKIETELIHVKNAERELAKVSALTEADIKQSD